jgi:hypothetical protein
VESISLEIEALTGTDHPRKYWNDHKINLKKGSELSAKTGQLKMHSVITGISDYPTSLTGNLSSQKSPIYEIIR